MASTKAKIVTMESLFASINKDFGAGSIGTLNDDERAKILHWSSTGIYPLDEATGWGLPGGRIVEYFGAESSGKTTALMAAMIENARRGGINVMFDAEGTFDQDRYEEMGGDPKKVIMVDPGTMEEFYDKVKRVLTWASHQQVPQNALVLVGVDSMPMLITQKQMDLEDDEELVAAQSRVNSRHLPTVDRMLPANTCLVLLNQVRDKIGGMAWNADGNIDTPGGRIIKHLCSIRVLFNKQGQLDNGKQKDDRQIVGMKTGGKVVKNKVAPPLRKVEFNIMFDNRGVDNLTACLHWLVRNGWITQPVQGVYKLKKLKTEVAFKAPDFAKVLKARPKWAAAVLAGAFTLEHPSFDLDRYLTATKPVGDDDED